MDKKEINSLTSYEITFVLVGTVIGVYILSAAVNVTEIAHQDGWISMMLGVLYPIYIVIFASYIIKKHPKDNILTLSKKYLGVILGNTLNFIFLLQFIFYLTFMTAEIINMLISYDISHISPTKTILLMLTAVAYATSKGIKTIAKINVIAFYIIFILIILTLAILNRGSLLNIMPVGGSGVINILKGTEKSFHSYATIEVLLLIHPFAKKGVIVKNAAFKAVFIICIIYTWIMFTTIYFLGTEIVALSFYPSIIIFQSIHIPVINNFVSVFMLMWSIIFLKSMSNEYFIVTFILNHYVKIGIRKICLLLLPPVIYMSLLFSKYPKYSEYFNDAAVYILIFNIIYVTIIVILIFLKQEGIKNSIKEQKKKAL